MSSLLIVDDHPVIRAALKIVLGALKDANHRTLFRDIREASNAADAQQMLRDYRPTLLVLDLNMPGLSGLDFLSRLQRDKVQTRVVVFTANEPRFYAERCTRAGALGFVEKTNDLQELCNAIKALMSGYTYFPRLDTSSVNLSSMQVDEKKLIDSLSDRELTIFQSLARGATNKEIAEDMHLSHKTISTYRSRMIIKLNVKSLVHLRDFAKRNHLL